MLGAESGEQCSNAIDDDADGAVNDGCPAQGTAESGAQCSDALDNDYDSYVNDGCPKVWTPDPVSDYVFDIDKNGVINQSDQYLVARNSNLIVAKTHPKCEDE